MQKASAKKHQQVESELRCDAESPKAHFSFCTNALVELWDFPFQKIQAQVSTSHQMTPPKVILNKESRFVSGGYLGPLRSFLNREDSKQKQLDLE